MFADPLTITINGVAKTLTKVNQDGYSSEYRLLSTTGSLLLTIRNSSYPDRKRSVTMNRHTVQLTETIFPVAPAVTSTVRKTYTVIENQEGDDLLNPRYIATALSSFISSANVDKLINFES